MPVKTAVNAVSSTMNNMPLKRSSESISKMSIPKMGLACTLDNGNTGLSKPADKRSGHDRNL